MAQVKIKDSWHAERETVYIHERSYDIGRGIDAWVTVDDEVAVELDQKIFEIKDSKIAPKVKEPETVQEVVEKTIEEKPSTLERIKDFAEDLLDDGKLNHSNNPNKKSPGRKKL